MQYRPDIDGLRALAVVPVVLFHYSFSDAFGGGYIGVDIFFVISGYLITSVIYDEITNGKYQIIDFYERRIRRIFPALIVVYITCIIISLITFEFPKELDSIGKSITYSTLFASNVLFYNTSNYFDQSAESNPVLHTWSLSVEEQFYVLFPIIIFTLKNFSHRGRIAFLSVITIASFIASAIMVYDDQYAAFYLVQFRAWELLLGALLALQAFPKLSRLWQVEAISWLGLLLIIYAVIFYSKKTIFPGTSALLPCLGATFIIYSGEINKTLISKILSYHPIRFIGLISYSLYLWHWPILVFIRQINEPNLLQKIIALFACFALATFSWKTIEKQFRKKPYAITTKNIFGAATASTLLIGIFSFYLQDLNKIYRPIPGKAERVISYLDYKDEMRAGKCFLTSKFNSFSLYDTDSCLHLSQDKKNIMILGDSHAAHLHPGLSSVYPQVNFMQATASGCKPVYDTVGEKRCTDLVNYIFASFLPTHHLDTIILSARWNDTDIPKTIKTAQLLRQYADKVVISGPIVEYDAPLPKILAHAIIEDIDESLYASKHQKLKQKQTDQIFRNSELPPGVNYVSAYSVLTTPNVKLYSNGTPVQFDYGHLTTEGSKYLAEQVGFRILGEM